MAVDVREEVDRETGAHALFVAEQKHIFQPGDSFALHREDHLVDDMRGEQLGQGGQIPNRIAAFEVLGDDGRIGFEEGPQMNGVGCGAFDGAADG